jgi:hypothetical protein
MIHWLQDEKNFKLITGQAAHGVPVVAGAKLKKTDAYKSLARFVNANLKLDWSAAIAKSRYEAYLKLYKVVE